MSQKVKLDAEHIALIQKVLGAIPAETSLAHAMLALEDAFVTLGMGMSCGLTVERTIALTWQLLGGDLDSSALRDDRGDCCASCHHPKAAHWNGSCGVFNTKGRCDCGAWLRDQPTEHKSL